MLRLISALVLLPIVLGVIWFTPPLGTWILGAVVLVLAFLEYAALARQLSPAIPTAAAGAATLAIYIAIAVDVPVEQLMASLTIVIGLLAVARGRPDEDVLRGVAVAAFPALYLGAGLGLSLLVREVWGVKALLLPFLTVVVSDSAQYYGGRTMGKRKLAPAISPKKTVEGAITGLVAAAIATPLLGMWAFPGKPVAPFVLLGVILAAIGICGDLFESLLKRSAGVKDASGLIPGHGGMLDRIDSLLFAGPVYYLFLRYSGL
jgi:phosphatidate cytidylyltransferase